MTEIIETDVLVVGGGTGGTAAAIQSARRGVKTLLVSEFPWLGGMLTAAGVTAPDGNELAALQTGLWGAFLRALEIRQPGGLNNAWVSFFTYEPAVGAAIFADWAKALPNLDWRWGHRPRAVLKQADRITGVAFDDFTVHAQVTLDGTELGDLLALGDVPHRWGWESKAEWGEPSAPESLSDPADPLAPILERYPVQSPTWVVVLQDFGDETAPEIPTASDADFAGAWEGYGPEKFLNYGRLPGNRFMLNWPQQGNDYGVDLDRLLNFDGGRQQFGLEARNHSQQFARYLQTQLGRHYGLAENVFPTGHGLGGGAFAIYPYYRESRRLVGLITVTERDILPVGQAAPLPVNGDGVVSAIAIGNYPNDHHYPGFQMPLAPKSIRWGGRWTGTPFAIPYEALVPANTDGLLACDKNISISHIANGATRLQPVVLSVGQAAGMAAALCVQHQCSPRQLSVRTLQRALLTDPQAPMAIAPDYGLLPHHPDWVTQQLAHLASDGKRGDFPRSTDTSDGPSAQPVQTTDAQALIGTFQCEADQTYWLETETARWVLVTLLPNVNRDFKTLTPGTRVRAIGYPNASGGWLQTHQIIKC
ncbi:MAG: FAD-dependent oxidoreductase [Cyanobacteria bacterium P01_D01_bin.14]